MKVMICERDIVSLCLLLTIYMLTKDKVVGAKNVRKLCVCGEKMYYVFLLVLSALQLLLVVSVDISVVCMYSV